MDIIRADPNVKSLTSSIGGAGGPGGGTSNGGRFFIELKPRNERSLTADQVIEELRPKVAAVPGVRVFLTNPPVINIGGRAARAQYQFTLQGGDTTELYDASTRLEQRLHEIPGLTDVSSDLQLTNPQVNVT
jgi:HAE1 family hydrophobic/amphiphilic exporter-1